MSDKIKRLPETHKSGQKVVKEAIPIGKKYKSYSTDQGMMVPMFDTSGKFVGRRLKRPKDPTKQYAGGGLAMRGYGKAYMKGGKVK